MDQQSKEEEEEDAKKALEQLRTWVYNSSYRKVGGYSLRIRFGLVLASSVVVSPSPRSRPMT